MAVLARTPDREMEGCRHKQVKSAVLAAWCAAYSSETFSLPTSDEFHIVSYGEKRIDMNVQSISDGSAIDDSLKIKPASRATFS
ncbi:hypothetical protein A0H81_14564 [Grifola frondosa]|uniref:Uncharacterized protein n=1 Tax=Grifola frondosa TaxID=5627 RepID=A0A1C7LL01_GRIFR|nr:hypothetical protein A0H81_14564 [Grifola frondosa]